MRFAYFAAGLVLFALGSLGASAFEIEGTRVYPAPNSTVTLKTKALAFTPPRTVL